MTWSHGQFHWNELMTRDVARAKKFYADTLGWSFDSMQIPGDASYKAGCPTSRWTTSMRA